MKAAYKIDVPVLLIFFVRDDVLKQTFASVKEAKPSALLLWQDGPRENNPEDVVAIQRCREVVEDIDWDCKVYKNYHDENMGCDPSTFLAQKWAFSLVDKCIILEDDRVPCPSFYPFCKELLDKYENDERINHICGTNLLGDNTACQSDYFFAPAGSSTWASWRRVAREWDEQYSFLDDEYAMSCLKSNKSKSEFDALLKTSKRHRSTGKQYWETILGMGCALHHRLAIIPKKNMVRDLGLTDNATHAIADVRLLPKATRRMFNMDAFDVSFPLKHPQYILPDNQYYMQVRKMGGLGYPFLAFMRKIEYGLRCIYYGKFSMLWQKFIRKFIKR